MPNKIDLPFPPELGAENRVLYSYLYKLREQLNVMLGTIEARIEALEKNEKR